MAKSNEGLERIRLNEVMNKMNYDLYELPRRLIFRYEWLIVISFCMAGLAVSNILGYTDFSGDLFWAGAFVGSLGLGISELYYERRKGI